MANSPKSASRSIYIDQTSAELALDRLTKKMQGLEAEIAKGNLQSDRLNKKIAEIENTKKNIQDVQDQISKGLRPTFVQVQNQVTQLRNELKRMSEDAPGYAQKFQAFKSASAELNRLQTAMNGVEKAQSNWLQEAKTVAFGVVIGNTVQQAIGAITSYIGGLVSGNGKLSDSLAQVRQTTGLTDLQVKQLYSDLKSIDTRTATDELLKIATIGGQFNVPKEQLKDFVQQIDKVNVVLGSEFSGGAEQITTEMSLLRNVFSDIKSDNISDDIGKISNAVVTLAQEGAATAPVISDFSKRLAPLEATANLSSGAVLGLSATLQELAVNPERGGTAVVKLFDKMISNADAFAKVAGMDAQAFKKLVSEDSFAAFQKVLQGFKSGNADVSALNKVIQDLEVSGVGAKEVLVKLSQNVDLLKQRTDTATDALTKTDKITEQFTINNTTLGAEIDKLSKKVAGFFTNSTLTSGLTAGVVALNDLGEATHKAQDEFARASSEANALQDNLKPLVSRYDELKSKTNLNSTEQQELSKIINEIIALVPQAAGELNKYGTALDINRGKLEEFNKEQKSFVQQKEAGAIQELIDQADELGKRISLDTKFINSFNEDIKKYRGGVVSESAKKSFQTAYTDIAQKQDQLLEINDKLTKQFQTQLPDALKKYVDAARIAKFGADKPTTTTTTTNQDNNNSPLSIPVSSGGEDQSKKIKQASEDWQKLIDKINENLGALTQSPFLNDLDRIFKQRLEQLQKIDELGKTAGKSQAEILKAKQLVETETFDSIKQAIGTSGKITQKPFEVKFKPRVDLINLDDIDAIAKTMQKRFEQAQRDELAKASLDVLQSTGRQKLDAQLKQLQLEEDQELRGKDLTENEKLIIEEKYRQKRGEAELEFTQAQIQSIQTVLSFAQQAIGIFDKFNQAKSSRENAALNRELKNNDSLKASYKKQLDSKILSQQQYDGKIAQLDAAADKKKQELERKQFERNKKIQIAQALVNGAMGITSVLAARPGATDIISLGAFRAINIAITTATTLAEVASIAGSKYALGGKTKGPSHANNGLPVINPVTGRKVAELEGDEGILKKSAMQSKRRYTVSGTPSQIASTLNSMYGGVSWDAPAYVSRSVKPFWKTNPYRAVNFPAINRTMMRHKMYESGGVFTSTPNASSQQQAQPVIIHDEETKDLMYAILNRLQNPVAPVINDVSISLRKLNLAQDQQQRIQDNSQFK